MKAFFIPLLLSSVGAAQPAGSFTPTGSMITPRFGHTATLLLDGRVLIAGGSAVCYFGSGSCLTANSAELYDPATGLFTATGSMTTIRPVGGILLPDGRVLFAGSYSTGTLAGIEIYDPSVGRFSVAGTAATLAFVNSATLLSDGRVLLTGIAGIPRPGTDGAEIYDPTPGTFSPVASWPGSSIGSPVVLTDGRVLSGYYEQDSEIYDPATGAFILTGGLCCFDGPPAATSLLNGTVLFTGSNDIGGNEKHAESFNPAIGTFTFAAEMATARSGHTATLLFDGVVLIAGGAVLVTTGEVTSSQAIANAELYDSATGTFSVTASMTTPRFGHAAVVLNSGQILIAGGVTGVSSSSDTGASGAEIYTPAVLVPAPMLFSLSVDGQGQGAIWHAISGQVASPGNPAVAGEILSMYTTNLIDRGLIPPQVSIGGRLADILFFGHAPGFPGFSQVNFRVPEGLSPGSATAVRLTYLGRPSNAVTIGVQ